MKSSGVVMLRRALLGAASLASIGICTSVSAQGLVRGENLQVIPNAGVTPGTPITPVLGDPRRTSTIPVGVPIPGSYFANSPQILDKGVNGIGQQLMLPPTGGLSLCSGTLINPRTVISAAHCVYNNPAHAYGAQTGTANIAFAWAFNESNRSRCGAGLAGSPIAGQQVPCYPGQDTSTPGAYEQWRDSATRASNPANNIYNVNQVWYLRSSQPVALGGGGEFANGDISLSTLDTPASDIPTWTMLFSPLDGPTHGIITGYGGAGSGANGLNPGSYNIDYRRRSAENMIDGLMSAHVFWTAADKDGQPGANHPVYWMDFDDPNRPQNAADLPACYFVTVNCTDFGALGGHGPEGRALPLEATTAGGDSGGPLIADKRFHKPVVVGVLTGSNSFTNGGGFYGQMNVYPPLFQFWQDIVANNPYVYASAKAGTGDWFDANHWVQDMDPNYGIIGPDGQLVTGVPDTAQGGGDGATKMFGTVCAVSLEAGAITPTRAKAAFGSCQDIAQGSNPVGTGSPLVVAGGPGSTNFVPNNVDPVNSADPTKHVKARYYDVTLRQAGTTTLGKSATIDKLTLDGPSKLDITNGGDLNVLTDYTQYAGWTNVDGLLKTGEAMIATGYLTGSGVLDPTYLTVVAATVAPGGGDKIGTLTIKGDTIMASASSLFIDVKRGSADRLNVEGVLSLSGVDSPGGSLVFNKVTDGAAPRHGESQVIASATGGIEGMFSTVYSFQGVLRPELTYSANSITALFRAGKLIEILDGQNATAIAFANALDQLRSTSYNNLYNLYGAVDLMGTQQLASTLNGLSPRVAGETQTMQDRQSRVMLSTVTDRLSMLGTGQAQGLSIVGSPQGVVGNMSELSGSAVAQRSLSGLAPSTQVEGRLPKGMTGFVSGGTAVATTTYGNRANVNGSARSWHMGMGLEHAVADGLTFGTAFGYSEGSSSPEGDRSRSQTTQVAAYGSYQLGGGAYLGAVASAESSRADLDRLGHDGVSSLRFSGIAKSTRYNAIVEAGVNVGLGGGLTATPRAQVGYGSYSLDGYREIGGETALQFDDLATRRIESRFGVKFGGSTSFANGWSFTPQVSADYVRMLSGADNGMKVRFAAAPDYRFALPLMGGETSWAEAKGGLKLTKGAVEFGAGVEAALGRSSYRNDRAVADFTFRF